MKPEPAGRGALQRGRKNARNAPAATVSHRAPVSAPRPPHPDGLPTEAPAPAAALLRAPPPTVRGPRLPGLPRRAGHARLRRAPGRLLHRLRLLLGLGGRPPEPPRALRLHPVPGTPRRAPLSISLALIPCAVSPLDASGSDLARSPAAECWGMKFSLGVG